MRSLLGRLALLLVFGSLTLAQAGCASLVAGDHEAETKFLLGPSGDGSFFGWSTITLDEDPNAAERATIFGVTVELMNPGDTGDLTFIQSVKGEAVTSTERTLVVQRQSFTPGETIADLEIMHTGDIRPFFENNTIRIEWTGRTNPAFTAWPAEGGFWIRVKVGVEIE
jgi:hypothetical protein